MSTSSTTEVAARAAARRQQDALVAHLLGHPVRCKTLAGRLAWDRQTSLGWTMCRHYATDPGAALELVAALQADHGAVSILVLADETGALVWNCSVGQDIADARGRGATLPEAVVSAFLAAQAFEVPAALARLTTAAAQTLATGRATDA